MKEPATRFHGIAPASLSPTELLELLGRSTLLVPEGETQEDLPPRGIAPGEYDATGVLRLLRRYQTDGDALYFIADMLETGNPEDDIFVRWLRTNHDNPTAISELLALAQ